LTNKGHIYACGFGSQGQLGLGTTDNKYEPVLVQSMLGKVVKMVAAGANHSLCLTSRADVYSCGLNAKGQLGVGEERTATNWTHVVGLRGMRVAKIFAGGDHSWSVLGTALLIQMNTTPQLQTMSRHRP
jgi:alpha-tubulin suppressor-like RCC1 family protein